MNKRAIIFLRCSTDFFNRNKSEQHKGKKGKANRKVAKEARSMPPSAPPPKPRPPLNLRHRPKV